LVDYLPDVLLEKFYRTHPKVQTEGITWKALTKLMQMANSVARKARKDGMRFNGKRSKTNLIRGTLSGPLEWIQFKFEPGVYLCGVCTAVEGHMFVLHVQHPRTIKVYDSMESSALDIEQADFSWVVRWSFIHRCHLGFF
jgi:hypothetical protein